jgi:hypothetical protein
MARPSLITQYLNAELPSVSVQKRLPYRPSYWEVDTMYKTLNRCVFDNQLTQPEITLGQWPKYWGMCIWENDRQRRSSWGKEGTWCNIRLSNKWYSPQWFLVTLAHEMVHQYQWDITRFDEYDGNHPDGAHGPSFFAWRDELAYWDIPLKTAHRMKKWMRTQNIWKC